jgi:hypothetical protein
MLLRNNNLAKYSLFIFLFINFIFSVKYSSRITDFYLPFSILITLVFYLIYRKQEIFIRLLGKLKINTISLLVFYFILCLFLFAKIPIETLNVDRWSVISSFWDNYFRGEYVYYAKSFDNNYPGPMPFYFILALPFYLIGELGLFSFLGLLLFILLGFNNFSKSKINIIFILTGFSLFFLWEICGRSNLFFNGVIILLLIKLFFKKYTMSLKSNLVFGVLVGLTLSTRNVFVIPYIITFIYALKSKRIDIKNTIYLGLICLITFAITFVPFVWNHMDDFLIMNPFIIQADGLIPFKYSLLFIIISIVLAFKCNQEIDVYFLSGLVLFLTILFYVVYKIIIYGFDRAFFMSGADITYFILCTPFLIFHFNLSANKC